MLDGVVAMLVIMGVGFFIILVMVALMMLVPVIAGKYAQFIGFDNLGNDKQCEQINNLTTET